MKLSITAMMSGAMCPEQLLIDCKKLMNCNVFVGYGSTECSPLITQAMGCHHSEKIIVFARDKTLSKPFRLTPLNREQELLGL